MDIRNHFLSVGIVEVHHDEEWSNYYATSTETFNVRPVSAVIIYSKIRDKCKSNEYKKKTMITFQNNSIK